MSVPSETQFTVAGGDRAALRRRRSEYVLLRISGLLLAILVLGHFLVTHITTDVANTNSLFIDQRWASNLWVGWDGLMLAATILHAVLGLWAVTADYSSGRHRRVLRTMVLGLAIFVFAGGMLLLIVAVGTR